MFKWLKKIGEDHYQIEVDLENFLYKKINFDGSFNVELFYKNYGTFDEDLSEKVNIESNSFYKDGKAFDFDKLSFKEKDEIKKEVLLLVKRKLNDFLFGN